MQYCPWNPHVHKLLPLCNTMAAGQCLLSLQSGDNGCRQVDSTRHHSVVTPGGLFGPVADQPRQFIQTLQCSSTGVRRNHDMFAWKDRRLVHIPL